MEIRMTQSEADELPQGLLQAWVKDNMRDVIVDGMKIVAIHGDGDQPLTIQYPDATEIPSSGYARGGYVPPPVPRVWPESPVNRFVFKVVCESVDGGNTFEADKARLLRSVERELRLRLGTVFKSVDVVP